MQDETAAYSTDGEHRYEIVDGVADFYIDGGGAAGADDEGNRKWLETDAVDGRDLYYERCREWEGMSFCLEQIRRLSYNKCPDRRPGRQRNRHPPPPRRHRGIRLLDLTNSRRYYYQIIPYEE
ncbi:MAG: hypothetical protein ACKVJG_22875 [Candidatus Latescibacterota bacterium]|jgi:hypothetical protein